MTIRRRKPRTWTLELARTWRAMYEADDSLMLTTFAQQIGRTPTVVGEALVTAGATIRPYRQLGRPKKRTPLVATEGEQR